MKTRTAVFVWLLFLFAAQALAQDERELEQEKVAGQKLKGEHPLVGLPRAGVNRPSLLVLDLLDYCNL